MLPVTQWTPLRFFAMVACLCLASYGSACSGDDGAHNTTADLVSEDASGDAAEDAEIFSPPCAPPVRGETMLAPEWVVIPGGAVVVGSDDPADFESPQVSTVLPYSYRIQTSEVTAAESARVFTEYDARFDGNAFGCPYVPRPDSSDTFRSSIFNFSRAVIFANARSTIEGLETCFPLTECELTCLPADPTDDETDAYLASAAACYSWALSRMRIDCTGYRLPTEVEWEWAARGGSASRLCDGDPDCLSRFAWWRGNVDTGEGERERSDIGGLCPNAFGLYDVLGGKAEVTADVVDRNATESVFVELDGHLRRPRLLYDLVRNEDGSLSTIVATEPDGACERCAPVLRGGDIYSRSSDTTVTRVALDGLPGLRLVQTVMD